MSANPPVHEIRMGKVKACVWENQNDGKTYHNVTVVRLYKDDDDWKPSKKGVTLKPELVGELFAVLEMAG